MYSLHVLPVERVNLRAYWANDHPIATTVVIHAYHTFYNVKSMRAILFVRVERTRAVGGCVVDHIVAEVVRRG